MPNPELEYVENFNTRKPSAANVFAILGIGSHAVDYTRFYTFDPGAAHSDIREDIGDGTGPEAVASLLRFGKRRVYFFPMAVGTAGSIGAVTKVRPSSPLTVISATITPSAVAAETDVSIAGPWDTLHHCIEITETGANGVGKFRHCQDDQTKNGTYNHVGTFSGDVTIPAETRAEIIGTIDLSTLTYGGGGDLDGLTFIIDSDVGAATTTTFAAPADEDDVVTQLNANNGGGTKYICDLVGANKLRVRSITAGTAGTLSITTGTSNSVMGFTDNDSDTGEDAVYTIPNTGVKLTFASATFTDGDLYTFDTVGPRVSAGSLAAAVDRVKAAVSDGATVGAVWLPQEDADAIDARTMADAFYTEITDAQTEGFDWWGLYQAPRSSLASDADVITYLSDMTAPFLCLTARGVRCSGGMLTGSRFHRPASWIAAWRAARERWSSDLGNHADGAESTATGLTELDGDERTASTKLATYRTPQTGDGGGFTVLETPSNVSSVAYFYRGRTMAAGQSILGDLNAVRVALACGRQVRVDLALEQNNDVLTTSAGELTDSEDDRIRERVSGNLKSLLFEDPEFDESHASSVGPIILDYDSATHTLDADFSIQRKGQFKKIRIKLGVVDTIDISALEA
jgi:hypothetical protein